MAREVRCHQTDRQTDRQTDTPTDYSNPRCACAPRVNNDTQLAYAVFIGNVLIHS